MKLFGDHLNAFVLIGIFFMLAIIAYVITFKSRTKKSINSASISSSTDIDPSVQVWENTKIREHAVVGSNSIIGRGVYIGVGVKIGQNCKIQNNSLLYEPAEIGDGVFIGPNVVLTNDKFPRAVNVNGIPKNSNDWIPVGVIIKEGASIGAQSVCVAPVTIGEWAVVGAGSVVTKDVPSFALVVGNPAKQIGWVGQSGARLTRIDEHNWQCPTTGVAYKLTNNFLYKVVK